MIKTPTTFILGAGASVPYGFPIGEDLMRKIIDDVQMNKNLFGSFGFDNAKCNEFCVSLRKSTSKSIDLFLESPSKFEEIGKLGIAFTLGQNEKESNIMRPPNERVGIYPILFHNLIEPQRYLSENKVSFLTFNYERSLEKFLFESCQNFTGRTYEEINDDISKLEIIHLHGTLGKLPYQDKSEGIEYRSKDYQDQTRGRIERIKLERSAKNILLMHDDKVIDNYKIASNIIKEAAQVYFLGFGYHEEILRRLDIRGNNHPKYTDKLFDFRSYSPEKTQRKVFRGTAYNLGAIKRRSLREQWGIFTDDVNLDGKSFLADFGEFI